MDVGDCHLVNGVLTLQADGWAIWRAEIWTDHTHSQDVWRLTFSALDGHDHFVFEIGRIDSAGMKDGDGGPSPHYQWSKRFGYDANSLQPNAIIHVEAGC
jgi:hypothetical protein